MLFQRINRTDPEKIFIIVKNSWSTAALADGYCVQWDFTYDKDGVGVTQPTGMATNLGNACAGIAAEAIASGDYGLVQVYGYHAAVHARANTTASNIVLGGGIRPSLAGGVWVVESAAISGTKNYDPIGFALSIWSSWTSTTISAFIKAL